MLISLILLGLTLAVVSVSVILCMPNFVKCSPPKKDWFTKAVYELNVYMVLFAKEEQPIKKTVETYHIFAYVYIRLLALYQDIKTTGSNWDIVWGYHELPKSR